MREASVHARRYGLGNPLKRGLDAALRGAVALLAFSVFALACGEPEPSAADAARLRHEQAVARADPAAARAAVEELRRLLPDDPATQIELADRESRAGDVASARRGLEEAVVRFGERADLLVAIAELSLALGDPASAQDALDRVTIAESDAAPVQRVRARTAASLGDADGALAILADAQSRSPEDATLHVDRITLLIEEARFAEALAATDEALEFEFANEDVQRFLLLTRADLLRVLDDERALDAVDAALARWPTDADAWRLLVSLLASAGRADEAERRLAAAVADAPGDAELPVLQATLFALRGEPERGVAILRDLHERAPSWTSTNALARALHRRGRSLEGAELVAAFRAQTASGSVDPLALEAALRLSAGDLAGARATHDRLRTAAPFDPRVEVLGARFDLAAGNAARAAARLSRALPRYDQADGQHWLAVALEAQGDLRGAEYRYGLAIARDPLQLGSYHGLLRVQQRRGAWQGVIDTAGRLLRAAPADTNAYLALARALAATGRAGEAAAVLRAHAERSDSPEVTAALASALAASGNAEEAWSLLEAAPGDDPSIVTTRAALLAARGQPDAALEAIDRALAARPEDPMLLAASARHRYARGDLERADATLEQLLAAGVRDAALLRLAGDARAARGDWPNAVRAYERANSVAAGDATLHFHAALAYEAAGDRERAIASYERAIALDPQTLGARNNLALLRAAQGDLESATRLAQANYAHDPADPRILDTLGWLYHQRGLAERAVALLERAAALDPDSHPTRAHLDAARSNAAAAATRPVAADETQPPTLDLPERPNLVLIVIDTLRRDEIAPGGAPAEQTPELARWAQQGIFFEHALAQSSWTKVSMASLLTALWPRTHGVRLADDGLADAAVSVAELLRDAGYATLAVQSNGWLEQSFGFHQGFDRYVFPRGFEAQAGAQSASVWPHGERVLHEGLALFDETPRDVPFFLYLHFMDVHEYASPPGFRTFGSDARGAYRGAVRWVDHLLGELRAALEAQGRLADTVIVLASDHGEAFGENRSFGHAKHVFTPVLEVPLLIRLPKEQPAVRVSAQVRNVDIAPTLLELAGVDVPEGFEGHSLLDLARGAERGDRIAHASLGAPILEGAVEQHNTGDGSWSYVRDVEPPEREFVFDRAVDPREDANLVEIEAEQAERLRALQDEHLGSGARPGVKRENVRIQPSVANRLRALGYLQ